MSLKKILKGDSSWSTRKTILGWIIDTVRQTIELPPHRKLELTQIFTDLANSKRVSHKKFQQILGKLRFVSTAIKGSAGLFSALQLALNRSKKGCIRITDALRSHLNAFASLAASLCRRPTHLAELVPERPAFAGTTDAAKAGMGGIYYDANCQPHLWHCPFPPEVQRALVSQSNPTGTITNSDLEHAAVVCQTAIMTHYHDVRYCTIQTNTDNTPTVSRVNKGTVTSEGPAAGLCHMACAHQRCHCATARAGGRRQRRHLPPVGGLVHRAGLAGAVGQWWCCGAGRVARLRRRYCRTGGSGAGGLADA